MPTLPASPRRLLVRRVPEPPRGDGRLEGPAWEALEWSEDFLDITGDSARAPRFRTRLKAGWDDEFLHFGAELEEPHAWGTLTERNSVIYQDNDFELFLDPDGDGRNYYELEINVLGTIWELSLPKPYRDGGEPVLGCNVEGLRSAVCVRGTLNDPSDLDEGWSVELSIPWPGLAPYAGGRSLPPKPGDEWRANFSRVQWRHEVVDGAYRRVPPHGTKIPEGEHPEDNWVWSPQGEIDMHLPSRWGVLVFA